MNVDETELHVFPGGPLIVYLVYSSIGLVVMGVVCLRIFAGPDGL